MHPREHHEKDQRPFLRAGARLAPRGVVLQCIGTSPIGPDLALLHASALHRLGTGQARRDHVSRLSSTGPVRINTRRSLLSESKAQVGARSILRVCSSAQTSLLLLCCCAMCKWRARQISLDSEFLQITATGVELVVR